MEREKKKLLLTMLIALTAGIPVLGNDWFNVAQPSETREHMMTRYRLPNDTTPRLYRIIIEPNMTDEILAWNGESSIDFEVLIVTRIVTLHAYRNLVIDENFTLLVDTDGNEYKPNRQSRDGEVEFFKIEFDRDILVGNYTLNLKYRGVDVREITGFYKASYPSSNFPHVAATHFEATTARRAFPCWDEPGLKARFQMSIKHYPNYTAISNMPEIERREIADGKIFTVFDTTPVMSIYLLTFVIADYESITNGNVTVWANKYALEELRHMLNTSQQIVDIMESYTGLSFGFPRIGSVLIPVYSSAATEHWGLVSYNARIMSFNPAIDTTMKWDRMNSLMAHELSHGWFGNRVSPLWWDDLWLNEAFAAYFQYYVMDKMNGISGDSGLFVLRNNQQMAFFIDLYERDVHVRWTPVTNREIRKLFSPVTYRKGAAILHMFHHVLSRDVFRAGIQTYLTKHSYKAVEADDLMTALQEAYDNNSNAKPPLNVKEVMMSWLMQTSGPIINVTRNYTTGDTVVTQRSVNNADSSKRWWVPLNYATKTNPNFSSTVPSSWISDKEDSVTIEGIDKDDWVIFNVQATGYYRVNYDVENLRRIVEYLNTDNYNNIHVINRAQIINDVHYFSMNEPSQYGKHFWQLTKYLSREVDYLPWKAAMEAIESVDMYLSGTKIYETFQKYIVGLMNSLNEKVGYETHDDDDYIVKLAKMSLVAWACGSGHSGCAEFSAERLLRFIENPIDNRLHPDNKMAIFCAGLRRLNDTMAQRIVEWTLVNDEKMLLLENLGCTENHEIHRNFILDTINENSTEKNHLLIKVFSVILVGSDNNFNFVVDFLLENHKGIEHSYYSIITEMSRLVKTKARLERFKKVLEFDVPGSNRIQISELLVNAESTVANTEAIVANLQTMWDIQVLPDNIIHDTNPIDNR